MTSGCATVGASGASATLVGRDPAPRGFPDNGVALADDGPGFVRDRPQADARYGVPTLVAAIARAAATVAEQHADTSPLRVGDLSATSGGVLAGHHSHRTGRDVDVRFYVARGRRSVSSRGFGHFDERGRPIRPSSARDAQATEAAAATATPSPAGTRRPPPPRLATRGVHFDVARNWALVQALLEDPSIEVQWIFVSEPLRQHLLRQGRRVHAAPETLARARTVLHQPRAAAPHDDHFHVRIACGVDELLDGCSDEGPIWPWMVAAREEAAQMAQQLDDALVAELIRDEPGEPSEPYAEPRPGASAHGDAPVPPAPAPPVAPAAPGPA